MRHLIRLTVLGIVFTTQIAGIAYTRFVDTRFLCWAPYDQISFYRIDATRDGRTLSQADITARYRLPAAGRENRSIHNLLQAITQFEATYGRIDPVQVRVTYRVNGGPEQTWHGPR